MGFNNSCDVNTFKYHQANQEIMVARRDIKAGEEVNDFYGEYFFQNSKLSRKKNLGFPCGCIPCEENWVLLDDLPNFTFEEVEARYDWAVEELPWSLPLIIWMFLVLRRSASISDKLLTSK